MITDEHLEQLNDLIERATNNSELLSKFENDFVGEWFDLLERQGTRVRVSDKQQYVFDRINLKLEKHLV